MILLLCFDESSFVLIKSKAEPLHMVTLLILYFPAAQLFGQAAARPPTRPSDPSRTAVVIIQTTTVRIPLLLPVNVIIKYTVDPTGRPMG